MVAAMEVPDDKTGAYGILDVSEDMGSVVSVKGMVEKPPRDRAVQPRRDRSLHPEPGGDGQSQQDRVRRGRRDPADRRHRDGNRDLGNVYGFRFRGQRFDCGSKAGFLQATVAFGMARDDLRDEFIDFLTDMVSVRNAAQ
jgi:UTP--glucose-1-phosphate uridylyltransferase